MVRVAAYYRARTHESLVEQQDAIRAWGEEQGEEQDINLEEFCDHYSVKRLRPQSFKDMMRRIDDGEIDLVVIHSFSAIFTSAYATLVFLIKLQQNNVRLCVVTDPDIDSTHISSPVIPILKQVIKVESDLISKRTREGMAKAKARGVKLGRKPLTTAGKFKKVKQMRDAGLAYEDIARAVELSVTTVYYHLNPEKRKKNQKKG